MTWWYRRTPLAEGIVIVEKERILVEQRGTPPEIGRCHLPAYGNRAVAQKSLPVRRQGGIVNMLTVPGEQLSADHIPVRMIVLARRLALAAVGSLIIIAVLVRA